MMTIITAMNPLSMEYSFISYNATRILRVKRVRYGRGMLASTVAGLMKLDGAANLIL